MPKMPMTITDALSILDSAYQGDMFLPHTKGLGEACRVMVEGYRAEREIAGEVAGAVQEAMDYILAAESCGYDGRIDTLYAAVMRLREISGAEPGKGESK